MAEAFKNLKLDSPLLELNGSDRDLLFALIVTYGGAKETVDAKRSKNPWQVMVRTVAAAGKAGARLKRDVFLGPLPKFLPIYAEEYADLPDRLIEFSKVVGALLALAGKAGHENKVLKNQLLVLASEFVLLRTRRYNDEHLADLIQTIAKFPLSDGFSANSITHERERLKKNYPQLYAQTLELAMTFDRCSVPLELQAPAPQGLRSRPQKTQKSTKRTNKNSAGQSNAK
jgi:hypothetical protein